MNTTKKAELTASVRHIKRFSKSGKPIYNSGYSWQKHKISNTGDHKVLRVSRKRSNDKIQFKD